MTSTSNDRYLIRITLIDRISSWLENVSHCYKYITICFINVCYTVDCVKELLYRRIISCTTIDACGCNGFVNIETGRQIGIGWGFLANPALICGSVMSAFKLGVMLVNETFRCAFLHVILDTNIYGLE